MLGAIAGDMIGSVYEGGRDRTKTPHFYPLFHEHARFTDDTVLTVALADSILTGADLGDTFKEYFRRYPHAGYGGTFYRWAMSLSRSPYNSWGNGSAMRVSPVGWAYDTFDDVMHHAKRSAEVTHNHPEGIKGAQATAAAIFLARSGKSKEHIKEHIQKTFGYDLERTLDAIRPTYSFDVSCQGSVPEAIIAFLESSSYEDAVRQAVSLGGDTDTQACIAGSIAHAFYGGVPEEIQQEVFARLDSRLEDVVTQFCERYRCG